MTLGIALGIVAVVALIVSVALAEPITEDLFRKRVRMGDSIKSLLDLDRGAAHVRFFAKCLLLLEGCFFGTAFLPYGMADTPYQAWKIFSVASLVVLVFAAIYAVERERLDSSS